MKDEDKTKEQLLNELTELRQRIAELEKAETERKRAVEELSVVYDALTSSVNGVIITTLEGKIRYANPAFLRMFEYEDRDEVTGKSAAELFATEKVKKFSDVQAIIDRIKGETEEFIAYRKDGTVFVVKVSSSVVTDNEGNDVGRMASFEDISEQKAAEEALAASKAYTESIIQNFLDTLIVVDAEAKIQTVNPATCHLLGYTEEEFIGQPVSIIFAEEEEEEVNRLFQFFREPKKSKAVRPQDTIRNIELNYKTKDGRLIPMSFNASVLTDEAGNVTGVVAGAKDLTEIKLVEEARLKSEERFRRVIENIFKFVPEGLLAFTDKLNLFRTNKAFQDIVQKYSAKLNYTEQELAEIIIEQVKNRIINEDYTEIRIPKNKDDEAKNR